MQKRTEVDNPPEITFPQGAPSEQSRRNGQQSVDQLTTDGVMATEDIFKLILCHNIVSELFGIRSVVLSIPRLVL